MQKGRKRGNVENREGRHRDGGTLVEGGFDSHVETILLLLRICELRREAF